MASAEDILKFAAERADETWKKNRQPYLLARLVPELEGSGLDYRAVLGPQRLKEFLSGAPQAVTVVTHPSQKSKVGLIPVGEVFEFSEEPKPLVRPKLAPAASDAEPSTVSRRRYIVTSFLKLVSELDEAEAAQVEIPFTVLTKLMRDR